MASVHQLVVRLTGLVGMAGLASLTPVLAAEPPPLFDATALTPRALPNNPSGNYSPIAVDCPADRPTARLASGLSLNESDWLTLRRAVTRQPLIDFLTAAAIGNFDAASYIGNASEADVPTIAIAVSGGGYRALMNGAGVIDAADSRTHSPPTSSTNGSISGLLQATTYLAGLSGGGWLVGSIYANNFSTILQLRDGYDGSNLWQFDNSIFVGPGSDDMGGNDTSDTSDETKRAAAAYAEARTDNDLERRGVISTYQYWTDLVDQVAAKADAGYDTSLTDYWGRALSYQLINTPDGGLTYTFSSIAPSTNFANGSTPYPILVADSRAPGDTVIYLNSTVFEFNPYEMGSWDPTTYGFVPTEYLGSNFSDGVVPTSLANSRNASHCVRGFDQFGFVMGTSSTLFNQFLLYNISAYATDVPDFVISIIESVLTDIGEDNNDIAQWVPNPFYAWRPADNAFADATQLTLIDGGEDLQNIPLQPLIQPARAVDVILAVDSSADTNDNWPNGTAVRATYERSLSPIANGTLFPPVPDAHTFINLGLNQRPTFFGCNASNFTLTDGQVLPPLIVYLPNAPFSTYSNVSTFQLSYTLAERNAIIQNGYNSATRGNGTLDDRWPRCLACAVLSRSWTRSGTIVPQECTDCFNDYCWDGSLNTTDYGPYEPTLLLDNAPSLNASSSAAPPQIPARTWLGAAAAAVSSTLFVLFAL